MMWSTKEVEETKHTLPEHKLLAAILKRAVYDLSGKYAEDDAEHSASKWFASDQEIDETSFTFSYICEHLSLDKKGIRDKLK